MSTIGGPACGSRCGRRPGHGWPASPDVMSGRYTRKALLKVGYRCNNNCVFCHSAPHRGIDSTIAQIEGKIRRAASLGADMLVLSGGEPTIRPDLLDIAEIVGRAGMALGLVTNARMLAYSDLVKRLVKRGLDYAYVSLGAATADLHDRQTRVESFNQTIDGLENLSGKVEDLTINTIVTRWNIDSLESMPAVAARFAPLVLKFSMIEPEGNALDNFESLVPSLKGASRAITKTIEQASGIEGLSFAVDGFPLCVLPEWMRPLESGLREDGFFIMSEAFEDDWDPIDDLNRGFGASCLQCSLRRRCRGVFSQYLAIRKERELTALSQNVPNSFNFKPYAKSRPFETTNCPIRAGKLAPPDPVRGIAADLGEDGVRFFTASTRDFSDQTIGHMVRDLGQVYLDSSGKLLSDDLGRDLVRLVLCKDCTACPSRSLCGGLFEPAAEHSFERARETISSLLAEARGSLLDIGCGKSPYLDAMRAAIEQGNLTYLGIDPYIECIEQAKNISFEKTSFDDFRRNEPCFDTVCALRSLNHLRSIGAAISRMAGLTRPGGRVVLAEDVVFGVVRPPGLAKRVESLSDLPFEHLTNIHLEEARKLCEECGLDAEKWFSTADTNSTLWLLVCRKRTA